MVVRRMSTETDRCQLKSAWNPAISSSNLTNPHKRRHKSPAPKNTNENNNWIELNVFFFLLSSLLIALIRYSCTHTNISVDLVEKFLRFIDKFFSSLPPFFSYGIYVNKRQMFFSGTHCHVHCILIKHLFFLFFHIFVVRCFVCWAWQTWNMLERIAYGTGPCVLCVGSMQSFVDCDKSSTLVLLLVTLFAWLEGVSFLKKKNTFHLD